MSHGHLRKKGCCNKFASVDDNGEIDVDEFKKQTTNKTKLLHFHTHFKCGAGTIFYRQNCTRFTFEMCGNAIILVLLVICFLNSSTSISPLSSTEANLITEFSFSF